MFTFRGLDFGVNIATFAGTPSLPPPLLLWILFHSLFWVFTGISQSISYVHPSAGTHTSAGHRDIPLSAVAAALLK